MSLSHAKGPWAIASDDGVTLDVRIVSPEFAETVATVPDSVFAGEIARLAAAAPQLRDALAWALYELHLTWHGKTPDATDAAAFMRASLILIPCAKDVEPDFASEALRLPTNPGGTDGQ